MKTAEEYISDVESKTGEPFDKKYLEDVLTHDRAEHHKEIIGLIDGIVEREKKVRDGWDDDTVSYAIIQSGINRLREFKEQIERLK